MTTTKSVAAADADMDSVSSFGGSPDKELLHTRPKGRYMWVGNEQVNHENFQRMLEEYRAAKNTEKDMSIKIKQLSAQLARTEEAAKRALVQSDPSAKGGAAQKLLDAERLEYKLREDNAELASKLAREKKRCQDFRVKSEELTRRLTRALQEQRALVERLGRASSKAGAKKESNPCSEENRRRFIRQQEELVALREDNDVLKQHLSEGREEAAIQQLQRVVAELQHQVAWYQAKGSQQAADSNPNEWLLDEVRHEGQMFLLDATTSKVFSFATAGQQPRPVGRYVEERVQLGSKGRLEEMLGALDAHLRTAQERLADVWRKFDRDGSGVLERRELQGFLAALLPNCSEKDAEELQQVLDANGDGKVTLDELLATAAQFVQARQELRAGTGSAASGNLQRVRTALKACIPQLQAAVQSELPLQQAAAEACKLVPGATAKEKSLLLLKLHMWDVHGVNRITPLDLLAALELRHPSIRRPKSAATLASGGPMAMHSGSGSSSAGATSSSLPGGPAMPTRAYREAWASDSVPVPQAATKPGEDVYLRDRVAKLEAELQEARKHTTSNRTEAAAAAKLRSELADTKSRLQELQSDMLAFDPANFSHLDDDSDAILKQLRGQVSAYRKRYSEGHAELEGLRSMHSRVVEQLEATHSALEAEQRARFHSEDEAGRLKMDLQHLKSLQESLALERSTRMKLEREVLALQSRALAAPSSALEEVRGLREDLFRAAREKAAAEQREAELRRQLNSLHREGEAVSVAEHQKLQDTLSMAQRRLVSTELELQAAREKLEVYRRTEVPHAMLADIGDPVRSSASHPDGSKGLRAGSTGDALLTPDGDKSAEEMRRELLQLRAVYMTEKADLAKVRKLLQHESEVVLEAKACEEAMRCEVEAIRGDMQQQLAALRRQLDSRDEQIRKLEVQLKSAYGGLGKVVRSSQVLRASSGAASQDGDLLRDLGPGENLLELTVTDAVLEEKAISKDAPTFVTLDFFMHETQSTSVAGGTRPAYDTTLQYVVEADRFFLEHLATGALSLELCEARGMDYVVLGSARLPLKLLLEDLRLGTATGASKAVHHVDVTGAQGQHVGRVRLMLSFKLPIDQVLLKDFCQALLAHSPDTASIHDQAKIAAKKAADKPGAAEHVRLQIHRCTGLRSQAGSTPAAYAHYRFPGFEHPHDTQVEYGSQPEFADESFFPMVRSRELDADLSARSLEVVVFDDNGGDSPLHSIIGVAQVPLSGLVGGQGVREHRLPLQQPVTQELTGYIELCLEWRNPLTPAPHATKGPVHGLDAELGSASPSFPQHQQQQQQQQHSTNSYHTAGGSIPTQSLATSITAALDAATLPQHSFAPQQGQQLGGNYTPQQPQSRPSSGSPPKPTRFAMDSVPRRDVLELATTRNSADDFGLLAELS